MAEIIPFPLARRRKLIARLRQSKPGEFRYYVRQQVGSLRKAGISEDEIERQLRTVFCAVRLSGPVSHVPGGAA